MPENNRMSIVSRTVAGVSMALVLLLFSALVLSACNNDGAVKFNEAQAEEIVLSDAGLKPEEVERMTIKTDYDDGRQVYEIDFYTSDKEYEYDVDAKSGEILKKEIEPRRMGQKTDKPAGTNENDGKGGSGENGVAGGNGGGNIVY